MTATLAPAAVHAAIEKRRRRRIARERAARLWREAVKEHAAWQGAHVPEQFTQQNAR